jgi:hypothetical protein
MQDADPDLCRRAQLWIDGSIVFAHHPKARVDARNSPVPALSPGAGHEKHKASGLENGLQPDLVAGEDPA